MLRGSDQRGPNAKSFCSSLAGGKLQTCWVGLIAEARDIFDVLNKTSVKRHSQRKPTFIKHKITLKAESKSMF